MLRRSHKKSRGGCLSCKARHSKCDKVRPRCLLCTASDRECVYPVTPAAHATTSMHGLSSTRQHACLRDVSFSSPRSEATHPHDQGRSDCNAEPIEQGATVDAAVNLHHTELVVHLMRDKEMWNLAGGGTYPDGTSLAIEKGFDSPYLMHALLAFSARHLAFLRQELSQHYMNLAITLQTRAVSLFNAAWCSAKVDQSNCVAVLGFSSVLGHHLLADTLAKREAGGLTPFLAHYTQCADTHRGVFAVVMAAWPMLMETELEPILSRSHSFTSRPPRGSHCDELIQIIDASNNMPGLDKASCYTAIRYLQVGFDAIYDPDEEHNYRYQMLYLWSMLLPQQFTSLLAVKLPEALAILAYYAVLLHHGTDMWQVGDAGLHLLNLIDDHLGSERRYLLERPRALVSTRLQNGE